jgi:hypothetical protein
MRWRALAWVAGVALLLLGLDLAWQWPRAPWQPAARPRDAAERFKQWQAAETKPTRAYFAYLRAQGVAEVLPPESLLRLGRRWQTCGGVEFAVPPRELWPRIVPTLKLLSELRTEGLLRGARVASAWRPDAYNRCEGGSRASRHLGNLALDLDLPASEAGRVQDLCARWQRIGAQRRWGLGFYSPTQVHLDTAGFRTWGFDFRSGSSLCKAPS